MKNVDLKLAGNQNLCQILVLNSQCCFKLIIIYVTVIVLHDLRLLYPYIEK